MKTILTMAILIVTPLICFCQKEPSYKGLYGAFYPFLNLKGPNGGGGVILGWSITKNIGIGGSVEGNRISFQDKKYSTGISTVGEIRFSLREEKVSPSVSFQYGTMNIKATNRIDNNTSYSIKGGRSIGGNLMFTFNKKKGGNGFFVAYTGRDVVFNITATIRSGSTYISSSKEAHDMENMISIGFKF